MEQLDLIKGDVAEEITKLKRQAGRDILVLASADLVHTLMQQGIVDEYRIRVTPVVVGGGKRFFGDENDTTFLRLVDAKTSRSGVASLTYRPAGE